MSTFTFRDLSPRVTLAVSHSEELRKKLKQNKNTPWQGREVEILRNHEIEDFDPVVVENMK